LGRSLDTTAERADRHRRGKDEAFFLTRYAGTMGVLNNAGMDGVFPSPWASRLDRTICSSTGARR